MGLDAAKNREPTKEEVDEMCRLLEAGLDAGACGWSVQRLGDSFTSVQRDYDGTPMVTDCMSDALCFAFADVVAKREGMHIQITQAKEDFREDLKFVKALGARAKCPILFNVVAANNYHPNQSKRLLKWAEDCQKEGIQMYLQGATVPNDLTYTFEDFNLLDGQDDWREVTLGDVEERMRKMQDPKHREALRHDYDHGRMPIACGPVREFIVKECVNDENKKWEGMNLDELGKAQGRHPMDAFLDLVVSEKLQTTIFTPPFNTDIELNKEIMASEFTVPGVSDGGAHTKFVTIGRYTTEFISDFVRDKDMMSLEEAHYRLSALPSKMAGFNDRGVIGQGRPADLVIYDLEKINPTESEIVHDFPGGEWRRIQKAEGYEWIMVNGEVTFEQGECTGATPGILLRGGSA